MGLAKDIYYYLQCSTIGLEKQSLTPTSLGVLVLPPNIRPDLDTTMSFHLREYTQSSENSSGLPCNPPNPLEISNMESKADLPYYVRTLSELLTPSEVGHPYPSQRSCCLAWASMLQRCGGGIFFFFWRLSVGRRISSALAMRRLWRTRWGKHDLDSLSDLFELLNDRLDLFKRIYISIVPERGMEKFSFWGLSIIRGAPQARVDDQIGHRFSSPRISMVLENLDLLKDTFQVPFSRLLTSLGLLRCRIDVDDASLLLAPMPHHLRALNIGTLIRTRYRINKTACNIPSTTWWRHFRLSNSWFLESLTNHLWMFCYYY